MLNLFRHEADHEEPCLKQQIFAGTSGVKLAVFVKLEALLV